MVTISPALRAILMGKGAPSWIEPLLPADPQARRDLRAWFIRILVAMNLILGFYYMQWRYLDSINWQYWPVALALLVGETYSYIDAWLFGLTVSRLKQRGEPPPPPEGATVDIFITCYNEPVQLVRDTVQAAMRITWPHKTYVLDDGSSVEMRAMAHEEGAAYIVRSADWQGRQRHAKAGNLNNALFQTDGEFMLILDADQLPIPETLHRTLGYFRDEKVAFVQTPQLFHNVPPEDPFGTQAPLFYGPIQQGKDGWNAAFFCGSNAVLRREALMQMGIRRYAFELEARVRRALATAETLLIRAERDVLPEEREHTGAALRELRHAVRDGRKELKDGSPIQDVTWRFQRRAQDVARLFVVGDLARIRAELADIPGFDGDAMTGSFAKALEDSETLDQLVGRVSSPLAAIEAVRNLLLAVDVDREDEAQPVMPMSTISVTEDMATAMRLHSMGWKSVYHHEVLVIGLAPEDLRSVLQQRLRWAQGTIQVMLRENPLVQSGMSVGQRLMYLATMWSYLSGFFALVYLGAPILYLIFGILPVKAFSEDFFWHLIPFLVVNQLLFSFVGWGLPTWRGQQYSLALFPLWIKAVWTAVMNVYFGRKLGFVVTPKTRQKSAVHLNLIQWQLVAMAALIISACFGLARLAIGATDDGLPIVINLLWICYDLLMLSACLDAVVFKPEESEDVTAGGPEVEKRGRIMAGAS